MGANIPRYATALCTEAGIRQIVGLAGYSLAIYLWHSNLALHLLESVWKIGDSLSWWMCIRIHVEKRSASGQSRFKFSKEKHRHSLQQSFDELYHQAL